MGGGWGFGWEKKALFEILAENEYATRPPRIHRLLR